jgi:hypothetical protein
MPIFSSPKSLYAIDECPDLMVDACLADPDSTLVFISLWARDTAVQEFLARLTLGKSEGGLERFHVVSPEGGSLPVFPGDPERLQKRMTRAYRRTLFGSLINVWLFDERCVRPDKANARALSLLPRGGADRLDRLWALVRETCPLPLLDHWRDTVLKVLLAQEMLSRLPFGFGPLEGYQLALDVPALTQALGDLIRDDALTAEPRTAPEPLRLAA